MSEVKVNKISPRTNCGTVTVGDSGDSVSVTAGVPVTVNGDLKSNALKATDGGSIISQSGTTITLGASGDTVSLASGASQTGFGRTGTVDWQTGSIKTGNFTAASGEGYFVNTTSGAVTATLPASPSAGDIVGFNDYARTFATNNLTIGRNSSNIQGSAADATSSTNGQSLMLVYVDATKGWIPTEDQTTTMYGALYISATGGNTISTCGDFKTHIFTGPGTFTVCSAGNSAGSNTVEYLVVAGGGSGGCDQGGGGGAGGFRSFTALSPASPLNGPAALPVSAQGYPVVVGGGGAGGSSSRNCGSNSSFSTITSAGGGAAGNHSPTPQRPGADGGSGGGAGSRDTSGPGAISGGAGNVPPVSPPQGKPGGTISGPGAGSYGAGGGGASTAGAEDISTGGDGSFVPTTFIGPASPSFGEPASSPPSEPRAAGQYFAGGGGARPISHPSGGGAGGGGPAEGSAAANMGGGGGAGYGPGGNIGAGGSGIVMIRYKFQ